MLRLVHDSDASKSTSRPIGRPDISDGKERAICSEPAAGGLTLYTFLDHRDQPIGYAMIRIAPAGDIVPREVVELYDLCAAEAAAQSIRMG